MLKRLSFAASIVMALAMVAWACPPDETTGAPKDGTVAQKSGCCQKGAAKTVADKEGGQKGDAKLASDGCCKSKGAAVARKAGCCAGKGNALVAKVMNSLPHITYKVGDKETGCPVEAAELAKASEDAKVVYLVGDKSFDSKDGAQARLASVLEDEAEKMLKVSFSVDGECIGCPHTASATAKAKKTDMKYRVAGIDFASEAQAEAAIESARAALAKVTVTVKDGDAERKVSKLDESNTPECGKASFVVDGEETPCPVRAKLLLAQARIRAMIEAAATKAS